MSGYTDYDVITIPASQTTLTQFTFKESDWMVFVNGIDKTAFEVNRKTGEQRPFDYSKAIEALFG